MAINKVIEIDRLIQDIQFIRMSIVAIAGGYDGDEGEKSIEDYIEFYQQVSDRCISDSENYIQELKKSVEKPRSEDSFTKLLDASHKFLSSFPFTYDEIGYEKEHYPKNYKEMLNSMINRYKTSESEIFLRNRKSLEHYLSVCRKLIPLLKNHRYIKE